MNGNYINRNFIKQHFESKCSIFKDKWITKSLIFE